MGKMQVVSFFVAGEIYCVDIAFVKEIVSRDDGDIQILPKLPEFVDGVLNLRGDAVPILNLQKFLKRVPPPKKDFDEFSGGYVILNFDGRKLGIAIDSTDRVVEISGDKKMAAPHSFLRKADGTVNCIGGVFRDGDGYMMLLDCKTLFSDSAVSVEKLN